MKLDAMFRASLLSIGALEGGQELSEDNFLADSILALEMMLDGWSTQSLTIHALTHLEFQTEIGVRRYTMGPTGDWRSGLPVSVKAAELYRDYSHFPLELIDIVELTQGAPHRTVRHGLPYRLYREPSIPDNVMLLDAAPDQRYVVKIKAQIPLLDVTQLGCSEGCSCSACSDKASSCVESTHSCDGVIKYRVKGAVPDDPRYAEAAIALAKAETLPETGCGCCENHSWTYLTADLDITGYYSQDDYTVVPVPVGPEITVEMYHDISRTVPKPFTLGTDVELPHGYKNLVIYNLAIDLATLYKLPVPQIVYDKAMKAMADVKAVNSRTPQLRVDPALTRGTSTRSFAGIYFGRS